MIHFAQMTGEEIYNRIDFLQVKRDTAVDYTYYAIIKMDHENFKSTKVIQWEGDLSLKSFAENVRTAYNVYQEIQVGIQYIASLTVGLEKVRENKDIPSHITRITEEAINSAKAALRRKQEAHYVLLGGLD